MILKSIITYLDQQYCLKANTVCNSLQDWKQYNWNVIFIFVHFSLTLHITTYTTWCSHNLHFKAPNFQQNSFMFHLPIWGTLKIKGITPITDYILLLRLNQYLNCESDVKTSQSVHTSETRIIPWTTYYNLTYFYFPWWSPQLNCGSINLALKMNQDAGFTLTWYVIGYFGGHIIS